MISPLIHDSIELHYQPLASCDGQVVGLESLMRWHHRKRNPISPEAFIPIFERCGLIVPLSRWALESACRDAAGWREPLIVAVNLSASQFDPDEDLVALVASVLDATGLPADRLELDVPVEILNDYWDAARPVLVRLRALGVRIALDDFGTAAPLSALIRDLPLTRIKIDGAVVGAIETSDSARSIVRMVVELGLAMGASVAAEGVERHAQLALLRDLGCAFAQGYLIGRPAPLAAYAAATGNAMIPARFRSRPPPRLDGRGLTRVADRRVG
jgi:EAL domain-containing protein (putative c-di-GMP-specific phosphodiesterase class I)